MIRKVLYHSYKRSATAIPVGNFVRGGIGRSERAQVQEYNRADVIIELRNGRTDEKIYEGNYTQVCQYLLRQNESCEPRIYCDIATFLDPNPPIDF